MYSFQALQIFIFLIPGLISAKILNGLVTKKETKEFEKIIEALIFSMVIYTIYSFSFGASPILLNQKEGIVSYYYNGKSLVLLSALSIVIPLIISLFVSSDAHMKLLRWLRITSKTARNSVWLGAFSDVKKHIIINFENGRRIYGWPLYYSDNPEERYIFLSKPAWIDDEKKEFIDLDVEGILITPEQKVDFIEFLKS